MEDKNSNQDCLFVLNKKTEKKIERRKMYLYVMKFHRQKSKQVLTKMSEKYKIDHI